MLLIQEHKEHRELLIQEHREHREHRELLIQEHKEHRVQQDRDSLQSLITETERF